MRGSTAGGMKAQSSLLVRSLTLARKAWRKPSFVEV
jgi:hypothetical protein